METKNNLIQEDYKNFISDFIQKQMVIVGPQIALDKAKNVAGLSVDAAGTVIALNGDAFSVVKNLIDEYAMLSSSITQATLCNVIEKYPTLREIFSRAVTKIDLNCPIKL